MLSGRGTPALPGSTASQETPPAPIGARASQEAAQIAASSVFPNWSRDSTGTSVCRRCHRRHDFSALVSLPGALRLAARLSSRHRHRENEEADSGMRSRRSTGLNTTLPGKGSVPGAGCTRRRTGIGDPAPLGPAAFINHCGSHFIIALNVLERHFSDGEFLDFNFEFMSGSPVLTSEVELSRSKSSADPQGFIACRARRAAGKLTATLEAFGNSRQRQLPSATRRRSRAAPPPAAGGAVNSGRCHSRWTALH